MKVIFQENGTSGVYYHRQLVPHIVMGELYPDVTVLRTQDMMKFSDAQFNEFDVVVLNGRVKPELLDRLSRHRKPFVFDIDDYWHCTPDRLFYTDWKINDQAYLVELAIKEASTVTTTSDILAGYIKKHTGVTAHVLPNYIGEKDPQFTPAETRSDRLRFGFIGGSSHVADIAVVGRAITKLWEQYPEFRDKWQIVYGGFDTAIHVQDTRGVKINVKQKDFPSIQIEKMLTNDYAICDADYTRQLRMYTVDPLPDDRQYRRIWTMDIQNYARMYNEIDILIAPLEDNTFNRCKSNLKVVEAGWMGKEVICANIGTFKDGITDGSIIMCSDVDEYLSAMVYEVEYFIEHGTQERSDLQDLVREHYNANNFAQKRYELYKSIL